jgi:SAM-dependent methyltransferase
VPRERSGPIGISKGDFATPIVRRRTTTQPRGIPTVGAAAAAAEAAAAEAAAGEAATTEAAAAEAAVGAVPEVEQARPPTPPEEGPFAAPAGARGDLASEAAALAAEAAAVRALDSGPLTPPPELRATEADAASAPPAQEPDPLAAADAAATPTPPPAVEAAAPTPAPTVPPSRPGANGHAASDDDMAAAVTPPPIAAAAPDATAPAASAAPPAAPEPSHAPELPLGGTPKPEPLIEVSTPTPAPMQMRVEPPEVTGALPTSPLGTSGSGASPEANLVANETEIERTDPRAPLPIEVEASEPEIEADDPLEVVDAGSEAASVASAPAKDGAPKTVRTRTPPPIPGSYFKTPGPEPISPPPPPGEDGAGPLLPGLSILPEALAQRPRRPKRSKPWFEEVFDEDYLRTLPFMRADQTLREVEFISETLRLGSGAEVLDVACGYGRHAIELVQRGVAVTGLDLSLPLLIRAADEAQRRGLQVNFVHADMREMAFERQFDGAYSMLTSFGYFDEETNLRVAERVARALKPGARFLLDIVNRDYVVSDLPVRVWWEGTGCVVLEEVDFNFHTSRILTHRSIVFEDGRQLEQEISVRAYSLHEIGRLLRQAGFRVIDVSGALATRGQFFGTSSRNLLIVAEKREEDVG